ncbi:hypothetical protein Q0590_03240 [Rhodocytophaga aerolata]|uniref:Uncharacterized protein n=1 Tax=Rhodocytophaga aerolata TaxID=455078 RepID=A0ABT8QZG8_9BACT|nr:hypothetical protein [Rhodocytophaga aerolata]MDO1445246.1 hypothetical protein [Rhodocytophaga aerolata]
MFLYRIKNCIGILLSLFLCIPVLLAHGQIQAGFIYGKITMVDNTTHEGVIQWSRNELHWNDIFRATKQENKVLQFLSSDEIKRLSEEEKTEKMDWGFMRLWENRYPAKQHVFECQFGYIRSITVTGEKSARLTLKNGTTVDVSGQEDTGRKIYILDKQGRRSKLEWAAIKSVVFKSTPSHVLAPTIIPLYGTVTTTSGEITGFIQWDMDESLNMHYLDGKQGETKKAFQFSEVSHIEKIADNTCRLTLVSGEKIELSDTDDVGKSNHGILVKTAESVTIKIKWHDFQKAAFTTKVPQPVPYTDYRKPKALSGKVKLMDGTIQQGSLIFDLDESMSMELLKGKSKELLYHICFSHIKSVQRKNDRYAAVTFTNGKTIELTGTNDVTDKNWGILITNSSKKPTYVPWNKVDYVTFTH